MIFITRHPQGCDQGEKGIYSCTCAFVEIRIKGIYRTFNFEEFKQSILCLIIPWKTDFFKRNIICFCKQYIFIHVIDMYEKNWLWWRAKHAQNNCLFFNGIALSKCHSVRMWHLDFENEYSSGGGDDDSGSSIAYNKLYKVSKKSQTLTSHRGTVYTYSETGALSESRVLVCFIQCEYSFVCFRSQCVVE